MTGFDLLGIDAAMSPAEVAAFQRQISEASRDRTDPGWRQREQAVALAQQTPSTAARVGVGVGILVLSYGLWAAGIVGTVFLIRYLVRVR